MRTKLANLLFALTRGRPMLPDTDVIGDHFAFTDQMNGDVIFYWRDRRNGTRFMATSPWSLFRVMRG